MSERRKILCVGDAPDPLLTTGFGNVNSQIWSGFHESGWDVTALGFLYYQPDIENKLPYAFWPTLEMDALAHRMLPSVIYKVKPDVIFFVCDPGNLELHMNSIIGIRRLALDAKGPNINVKAFCYVPTEGRPLHWAFHSAFKKIQDTGGKVITWSPGSAQAIKDQFKDIEPEWAYFGSDHAPFKQYKEEYRTHLRKLAGFDDYFIVGSVGVNKRTKGFDTIIKTAAHMKYDLGVRDVKFYLHTSASNPTMQGYDLSGMTSSYGVEDMILFKPDIEKDPGGNIQGISRTTRNFAEMSVPETEDERKYLFMRYSFIDRMNCLDMYLDASQVEGWGLPAFEAMKCGVPTAIINDGGIRTEVHAKGCLPISVGPDQYSQTWHTGASLPAIGYEDLAKAVMRLKTYPDLRRHLSKVGQELAGSFKWGPTKEKIVKIVEGNLDG